MAGTITISYSELDTFRQCPMKHEFAYKERWQSPTTGPALSRGTRWHAVMEHHYRALAYWQRAIDIPVGAPALADLRREIQELYLQTGGSQSEEQELVEWMYDGYVGHYGADPQWRVLAVEHAPFVWLPTDRGGRSRFQLKLKIDLVVRNARDEIWVVDHKSGKDLPKDKELELDDQFGLYTWAMRKLGMKVMGSVHSGARTQRNKDQAKHFQPLDERFARKHMYRTDIELDTLAVEAYRAARRAYAIPIGQADRATNPDTCRWRCDFTEPCLGSRKGMDRYDLLTGAGFVQDFTRH